MNNLYNFTFLLKLTENDKRIIWMFVLIIVAILSFLILISLVIEKIGKKQAKRVDILMHDLVMAGFVDTKKKFKKLALKKSNIYFYRHSRIAVLLILLHFISAFLFVQFYEGTTYAGLYTNYETYGLATIFPIYDFNNIIKTDFFGLFEIITGFGDPISTPHFVIDALFAYISIPIFFVGGIMFLFQVQGLIARTIRIHRLARKIYSKNLENVQYNPMANVQFVDGAITVNEPKKEEK